MSVPSASLCRMTGDACIHGWVLKVVKTREGPLVQAQFCWSVMLYIYMGMGRVGTALPTQFCLILMEELCVKSRGCDRGLL